MLLASDFDNTLHFHVKGFRDEDLKAIKDFQRSGHLFGVCTGRSYEGILRPTRGYDLTFDFYILLSGALILDANGSIIAEKKLPYDVVKEVIKQNRVYATIVNDDVMYFHFFHFVDRLKQFLKRHRQTPKIVLANLNKLNVKEVNSFSLHFLPQEIEKAKTCTQMINERYGDIMTAFQNKNHVDVAAAGCSKGQAIETVRDYYHLQDEDLYAIGDSWNDVPMFEHVVNSYTFNNSPDDVKAKAHHYVNSLDECIKEIMTTQ
ncbi:MAG: HAD-IIB family hydrolase [Erysipelotrichaceae bacterium]|nr:HAD-IIB family hydrolase [Erysipelotrichaceae bacterium]